MDFAFMYVCAPLVCFAHGGQKRGSYPLRLPLKGQLWATTWVLGIDPWSSARSASTLDYLAFLTSSLLVLCLDRVSLNLELAHLAILTAQKVPETCRPAPAILALMSSPPYPVLSHGHGSSFSHSKHPTDQAVSPAPVCMWLWWLREPVSCLLWKGLWASSGCSATPPHSPNPCLKSALCEGLCDAFTFHIQGTFGMKLMFCWQPVVGTRVTSILHFIILRFPFLFLSWSLVGLKTSQP